MNDKPQQFASDNNTELCPEAWAAMDATNQVRHRLTENDVWTQHATDPFRKLFEKQ